MPSITRFAKSPTTRLDYAQFKEQQYDRLANPIREHIDMAQIYASMRL